MLYAYQLVFAALLITAGRLGDVVAQRRLLVAGLALFTAASDGCGLAHAPEQIITARVAQGVGAALLSPQTLILTAVERSATFPSIAPTGEEV